MHIKTHNQEEEAQPLGSSYIGQTHRHRLTDKSMTFFSLFTASGHIYRHVCYKHAITVLLVDDDSVVLNNLLHANQWYTHILLQDGPLSWFSKGKKNAGSSAM